MRKSRAKGTHSVPGAWLEGTGIKGWRDGINVSALIESCSAQTQDGNSQPERCTVVVCCWARAPDCREEGKKGGERGRDREENREKGGGKSSRNYALGKPGSMEPDSSRILCSQLSGVEL